MRLHREEHDRSVLRPGQSGNGGDEGQVCLLDRGESTTPGWKIPRHSYSPYLRRDAARGFTFGPEEAAPPRKPVERLPLPGSIGSSVGSRKEPRGLSTKGQAEQAASAEILLYVFFSTERRFMREVRAKM